MGLEMILDQISSKNDLRSKITA